MAALKPGMRIMTDGPSMIPPITSAITRGCRILERGQCSNRQKMIIIPAYFTCQLWDSRWSVKIAPPGVAGITKRYQASSSNTSMVS